MKYNRRDGQYYYAPHRSSWGVWQWHEGKDGDGYGTFVNDFPTKEEARKNVYNLNGWFK